ncbi:hypothetical protein SORBI_3004G138750 [Sorghum bicolor]|uniref:Uncharacterized protein n=1 Tax=Sorghum bicolor TaxID=4558 RepID=A0A1Z5RMJ4_SORBI|nr:hypothetical protein SORBI_3004G138750 [Sorghum bicolor]
MTSAVLFYTTPSTLFFPAVVSKWPAAITARSAQRRRCRRKTCRCATAYATSVMLFTTVTVRSTLGVMGTGPPMPPPRLLQPRLSHRTPAPRTPRTPTVAIFWKPPRRTASSTFIYSEATKENGALHIHFEALKVALSHADEELIAARTRLSEAVKRSSSEKPLFLILVFISSNSSLFFLVQKL